MYRNPLGAPFQDATEAMGFSGAGPVRGLAWLDSDDDARVDLLAVGDRLTLWHNQGQGRFEDATAQAGLSGLSAVSAVAVGDYDNDGGSDLFLAMAGGAAFYRGHAGRFEPDRNARVRVGAAIERRFSRLRQ